MWLTMIARNWQLALLALMTCAFTLSIAHGRYLKSELDAKIAEISAMRIVAQSYADQSEITAKETSSAFTTLVEQIKDKNTALKNTKARFGAYSSLCPRSVRLPTEYDTRQTSVPESPSGVQESERVVIDTATLNTCATDSAFVSAVHEWRIKNHLPVQ